MKPASLTILVLTAAGVALALAPAPSVMPAARSAQLQKTKRERLAIAIEKGAAFLKGQQASDGGWTAASSNTENNVGMTCLAGLALLLTNQADKTDPAITSAIRYVHKHKKAAFEHEHARCTYALSLAVVFLDYVGSDPNFVREATVSIATAQNPADGGWSYECPLIQPKDYIKKVEWLHKHKRDPIPDDIFEKNLKVFGQGPRTDNSTTQFAIMALYVGKRAGAPADYPLRLAEKRFRKSQDASGGWTYQQGAPPATATMTCAGLLGLALGYATTAEQKEVVVRSGKPPADGDAGGDGGDAPAAQKSLLDDKQVKLGEEFLGRQIGATDIPHLTYFLWGLERVAMAYGWDEKIAGKDWYGWGSDLLLQAQQPNGSWSMDGLFGPSGDTAFALLFLSKANLLKKTLVVVRSEKAPTGREKDPGKRPAELAEPDPQTDAANRLRDEVVNSFGARQADAIKNLTSKPGKAYTRALADTIRQTSGGLQTQLRDALVERLHREKPADLRAYLKDTDAELRMAAAWACALAAGKEYVPDLIPLLGDKTTMVADKAHEALKTLTGQDLGRDAAKWNAWAEKNVKPGK